MIFLSGCMVGPKYKRPAASVPPAYKELPETDQWKVAHPNAEALRSNWWEIFGDPQLNALEEQVTVSNQNLKMAAARFRQARATVRYYRAGEFPTIAISPGVEALRYSPNQPYFPSGNASINSAANFLLPFDLSYEVDLWGRIRRTVAAAREEAQASAGDLASHDSQHAGGSRVRLLRIAQRRLTKETTGRNREGLCRYGRSHRRAVQRRRGA